MTAPQAADIASAFFSGREGLLTDLLATAVEEMGPLAMCDDRALYRYDEGVWRGDGDRIVRQRCARLLRDKYRMMHATTALDYISSRDPVLSADQFDARFINVPNGLLDWRDGRLHPHDPAVQSVVRIPVEWHPGATCPVITGWLGQVLPAEFTPFVFEVLGYLLHNGLPIHKALMLLGSGRNGKGTFLRLARALAGAENCAAVGPQALDENRFMPAKLHGKLANLIGDVDPRTFRVTETFKKLTGQDEITAEHKHGQPFTFTSRALIIAGFNETPHASDTTAGFFERWITIPFVQYYPDEVADKELDGKLQAPAELQGLLVQAAAGLRRLMERGHFEQPELVRQATTGFRQKADRVRSFVRENTSYGKDAWTERKDVYAAYKSWADDGDGRKPLSSAKFYERLPPAVADVLGQQTRITTKNGARGFDGLKLAEPPEPGGSEGHREPARPARLSAGVNVAPGNVNVAPGSGAARL